jgi:hypothetical protein
VESALDKLAEKKRPDSVPAPWMRQNWLAKANGNVFAAYKIAAREST